MNQLVKEVEELQMNGQLTVSRKTEQEQEQLHNKMINEEYKIWKKNSVFLYDIMYRCVGPIISISLLTS